MRRVVVTGMGIVCSLGRGREEVWRALSGSRRGFGEPTLFDRGGASKALVGEVELPREAAPRGSRLDRMLALAADEALAAAAPAAGSSVASFGISLGTSNGGMLEAEGWYARHLSGAGPRSASAALRLPASAGSDALARRLGLRGSRLTVTTACSSSAAAIALAAERIRDGEAEGMIAGGGDPLCRLTYAGFSALRLLDPEGCRPFAADRRGLTLGEGAALLVLEDRDRALGRGAALHAELLEHGASCDAHHMTGCHPEGRGMKAAMLEAIERAGVRPGQIDYVNAHGTATPANDAAEGRAIADLLGDGGVPVSSTKSMHGHLLGGSGAVEAAVTILALERGLLPPTAGTTEVDPGLAVDLVGPQPRPSRARRALSNSFGFGGGNVVLLFASADAGEEAGRP